MVVQATRCLVPTYGDTDHQAARARLWDKFYTAAPTRQRQCVSHPKYHLGGPPTQE